MHGESSRRIGIAGMDRAHWGEHLCVFFNSKSELLSLAVPFIKAGLEDHESCIWITGDPTTEQEAFEALEAACPDAPTCLARRQLKILSSSEWYLPSGTFDMQIVLDNLMHHAERAQAKGFAGIRVTGNPAWVRSEEDWTQFAAYEETVHQRIQSKQVLALCTYPVWICQGKNVLKTLKSHSSALLSENEQWRRLELSAR
jgi:hypothetical protein